MLTRHLLAVENRYWHYRQQGDATAETAIVLLHTLPGNSAMLAPLFAEITGLRPKMRILAPDMPGYGGTDALLRPATSLQDYLPSFRAFFREMGLRQVILYGTGMGAQLAIAYANAYPDKVANVVLDNAFQLSQTDKEAIPANPFPDLTPRPDGGHLKTAWQLASGLNQYFPWFTTSETHRIGPVPTPEQTHQAAMELLNAGAGYSHGYQAAFDHERAENVQRLTVPTTLFRGEGSPSQPQTDALVELGLPANIQVVDAPATGNEHDKAVAERLVKGIKN
ncbi:alpha/beta fold hydrolase [Fibrella forsythiae]|uniref:Alpha/beta hydrolase n=1 Tax=Fibrella forsythiae TaxID=2817061 RepID=A0ABS3JQS8_9BACT|nr:alpha/beta hydrolase [Fibrella forsythiae]MBO0952365.1 alpha/beta hydrolase [Fibrella forsythiae]